MQLPRAAEAVIEPFKLSGYLLDISHPDGGPKARFFVARGFRRQEPHVLELALLEHPRRHDAVLRRRSVFGDTYEVRCAFSTPDGSEPCIRSFWQVRQDGLPYLITAYPI